MYSGAAKIVFKTQDISELPPVVNTSVAAIVMGANKGNVDLPQLITDKAQLLDQYAVNGKPAVGENALFCALEFLEVGKQLYVMRVHNGALYGGLEIKKSGSAQPNAAVSAGVANPSTYSFGTDGLLAIFAKDPGAWDNSLGIQITNIDAVEHTFDLTVYQLDESSAYQVVETWAGLSRVQTVNGDNNSIYVKDVINGHSNYIRVEDNTAELGTVDPKAQATTLAMAQGANGSAVGDSQIIAGWDKFLDKRTYPINILINGGYTSVAVQTKMKNVAETRWDCTAVLDIPFASTYPATAATTWRTSTQNINSSFVALHSPWYIMFDAYNGRNATVPPSGAVAAAYALTDYIYGGAHGAPAGYNRGVLKNALSLAFATPGVENYTEGELDALTAKQINPIIKDNGWGYVIFDELTQQSKLSKLSNVHVRRLINEIATSSVLFAKPFLFEPLIDKTYFRVETAMVQFMGEKAAIGMFDSPIRGQGWDVKCSPAVNNGPAVRDRDTLNIWLFIKPVAVARYIEIRGIITRATASFEAIINSNAVV